MDNGPPSGAYLTAAPKGGKHATRFSTVPYTGQSKAFKKAYARAHNVTFPEGVSHYPSSTMLTHLAPVRLVSPSARPPLRPDLRYALADEITLVGESAPKT